LRAELACAELPRVAAADLVFPFFDCSAARARVVEDDLKFRVCCCCTELARTELFRVCCCLAALARAALFRAALARLAEDDFVFLVCFCCAELERARVAEDDRAGLAWERVGFRVAVCLEAVCRAADFCGAALEDFEDLDCPTATP